MEKHDYQGILAVSRTAEYTLPDFESDHDSEIDDPSTFPSSRKRALRKSPHVMTAVGKLVSLTLWMSLMGLVRSVFLMGPVWAGLWATMKPIEPSVLLSLQPRQLPLVSVTLFGPIVLQTLQPPLVSVTLLDLLAFHVVVG